MIACSGSCSDRNSDFPVLLRNDRLNWPKKNFRFINKCSFKSSLQSAYYVTIRDVKTSSNVTESAVKNEPSIDTVLLKAVVSNSIPGVPQLCRV